ncbi:MAG TPA: hypothetical protein VKO63_11585, partial [Chitinispirillaceae bacterium]|nr:hypothetical protein [Chitinispirillaceae bacterium]
TFTTSILRYKQLQVVWFLHLFAETGGPASIVKKALQDTQYWSGVYKGATRPLFCDSKWLKN